MPSAGKQSRDLGLLVPVRPKKRLEDGSPVLGDGEVYVTRTGRFYHSERCDRVLERPRTILVTRLADVGLREHCPSCQVGPELIEHFKFEKAEWQRLTDELNRLGRDVTEYLLAKGPEGVNAPFLRSRVSQYRETKTALNALSLRVAGVFPESFNAPNW